MLSISFAVASAPERASQSAISPAATTVASAARPLAPALAVLRTEAAPVSDDLLADFCVKAASAETAAPTRNNTIPRDLMMIMPDSTYRPSRDKFQRRPPAYVAW